MSLSNNEKNHDPLMNIRNTYLEELTYLVLSTCRVMFIAILSVTDKLKKKFVYAPPVPQVMKENLQY